VGIEAAISKQDHMITAYREHCNMMGRGGTSREILAELLGKAAGCSSGKGGSMHMYKRDSNFYGGNGIVGAQIPIGAGIAMAQQYLNTGKVCVTMFGDGAANQGQVFEAFNMSALWKLPIIYICENNHYAMGTAVSRGSAQPEYYRRGDYIPGIKVDGMNVLAVKTAMKHAVEWVLNKGPIVLEMDTYRYSGHSMSDPGTTYRTRDEIARVRESKDPVANIRGKLLSRNLATEDDLKVIEKEVKNEMDDAVQFAKETKEPEASELYNHVYKEQVFVRGVELAKSYSPDL